MKRFNQRVSRQLVPQFVQVTFTLLVGLCLTGGLIAVTAGAAFAQEQRADSGYAVFVSQRSGAAELYLLNLETLQVSQLTNTGRGHLMPAISANARELVYAARAGNNFELFTATLGSAWRTRRPTFVGENRLTLNTADEVSPSISGDGYLIAFASPAGIETMSSMGTGRQLILPATDVQRNYNPVIAPAGNQLAFISNRNGSEEIWVFNLKTGEQRQLTTDAQPLGGLNWSPDGKQLVFTTANTASKLPGVALISALGGGMRVVCDEGDSNPSFSADGEKLLFTSMRDGDSELYLLHMNSGQVKRLTYQAGLDDGAICIPATSLPRRLP